MYWVEKCPTTPKEDSGEDVHLPLKPKPKSEM